MAGTQTSELELNSVMSSGQKQPSVMGMASGRALWGAEGERAVTSRVGRGGLGTQGGVGVSQREKAGAYRVLALLFM